MVTQYSMGPIEEIGLLKMDFLGLRNLDVIEDAVEIVERSRGESDRRSRTSRSTTAPPTRCSRAATRSASSSSSPTACATPCGRCKPTEFQDLVALVSLYRPGAMTYIPQYAQGKRNPRSITYPDERMRPITESTYGCVIYQEQLMEIAKQMAGFSPAEADDLRKAIGKKKRDLMATMKDEVPGRAWRPRGPTDASPGTSGR